MNNYTLEQIKQDLKEKLMDQIDLSKDLSDDDILDVIDEEILKLSRERLVTLQEKIVLRKEVFHTTRGLDVLQELVEDEDITEIMVNGPFCIFIEKKGRILPWDRTFQTLEKLEDVVQQMVSMSNRSVNEANPIVDVRLRDGSRANVVLPPVALEGPIVTIRKFPKNPMTMEELVNQNSITEEAAFFLGKLMKAKYNIFISGGTGSGKTTFLNALSDCISRDERVITIEDSAELQIRNIPNLVRLEVRNPNVEGKNQITMRDLLKTSLRMRPDRIIIGEVRDAVAVDMLAALNTGHAGCSTGHANSSMDMLSRLESLVLTGMDIPLVAIRRQISSAIDVIVHLGRLRDKSRKVLEISEILPCSSSEIEVQPLYIFQEAKEKNDGRVEGNLVSTGVPLKDQSKLQRAGL